MTIEKNFDIAFISGLALREKQIQQNYRPVIAVHKWFARRPGTLFRGLVLSEFGKAPLQEAFYKSNSFPDRVVADPFMGGGTPLLEANRVGCHVIGLDINPMSVWVVREEIEHLDLTAYEKAAHWLTDRLQAEIGFLYRTRCVKCNESEVPVKYFLWIKEINCGTCDKRIDLFPGYLIAENVRHPKNVLICSLCGELNEVSKLDQTGSCRHCGSRLVVEGPAKRNRCTCPHCGHVTAYPTPNRGRLRHRMFAIEYHCPSCKPAHRGRFFKKPDSDDLTRAEKAAELWRQLTAQFVPSEEIPAGDETDRLHRWGYRRYRELFNARQLLGLEHSCRLIRSVDDERVRRALATNLSDLLRYQNMLCRYDTMALKSLDIFSIHGFPVGLVPCESNLLGISNGAGASVGSGGWSNIIAKFTRAKRYCDHPFEILHDGSRKIQVPIRGEWIGEHRNGGSPTKRRRVSLHCQSATGANLPRHSLDAVLTDPPYFGNVQYGELMDFCYVWLRRLTNFRSDGFARLSTRDPDELTGNIKMGRGLEYFTEGLGTVFRKMAFALKPGAPLGFTFHHNKLETYCAVGVAILDAGLVCSASLPCPAEMAGSIHIHGTGSSVVDTVFVCRVIGAMPRKWMFSDPKGLLAVVSDDLSQLQAAGLKATQGDIRCIVYGHLTRMAIWDLRMDWRAQLNPGTKLKAFAEATARLGTLDDVLKNLDRATRPLARRRGLFDEAVEFDQGLSDAVSF